MTEDIRFVQRFNNFLKAFDRLEEAVNLSKKRNLSYLEELGLIQIFKYNYELAWNVMRDFLTHKNLKLLHGPKDTVREAFRDGLINDDEIWDDMIKSRDQAISAYNRITAAKISLAISENYFAELVNFKKTFNRLKKLA